MISFAASSIQIQLEHVTFNVSCSRAIDEINLRPTKYIYVENYVKLVRTLMHYHFTNYRYILN